MLKVTSDHLAIVEKQISREDIDLAIRELKEPISTAVTITDNCTDCEEGSECADCLDHDSPKPFDSKPYKSSPMNDGNTETAYNFNLVLPNKNPQPTTSDADKRKQLIYMGVGLIVLMILLFIALRSSVPSKKLA